MLRWLKSFFRAPEPAGPQQTLRAFTTAEPTITQGGVRIDDDGWRIDSSGAQTVRLFDVKDPGVEQCLLAYRAEIKTDGLEGRAYLEMWCCLPGRGEFFSKGFHNAVSGTTAWSRYEIPFFLKKGQRPDLIKLNVMTEGAGVLWIRNVELLTTPLTSS